MLKKLIIPIIIELFLILVTVGIGLNIINITFIPEKVLGTLIGSLISMIGFIIFFIIKFTKEKED